MSKIFLAKLKLRANVNLVSFYPLGGGWGFAYFEKFVVVAIIEMNSYDRGFS